MRVIGTAGHVDHGKSTLVHQLTDIDPDRLIEEKRREMTIDLGFAWLTLPNDETIGIIDVPGHRDFIENMLAGVGGIDAVLLVIAADEGVMPQTREHLAILDLLGIENGLIILTKTDLVDDPDWIELVELDVREVTQNTTLADVPILRVSALTGDGIPDLIAQLTDLLSDLPPNLDYNHPRLAIDRVFTISGFGTVVTGTLLGGTLSVGDEIEIQPGALHGRVRGLQSYKQPVDIAQPGSRVAVNITGIEKSAIQRGHALTLPRQLQATLLADIRFRHLADASRPLKHNAEVKFFVGAAETTARVRLLEHETLLPGEDGWLQIRLGSQLPLAQGDRFIIRYPSPPETIGGGIIVNPYPGRRWKRFQAEVIQQLELRAEGTPAERVAQAATATDGVNWQTLQHGVGYSDNELESAIQQALDEGLLLEIANRYYVATASWQPLNRQLIDDLAEFHRVYPLRRGMGREQMRVQLGIKQATLNALLDQSESVISNGNLIHLSDHEIRFTEAQASATQRLVQVMKNAPYTPPTYSEAVAIVSEDVLIALIELDDIVRVQAELIFSRQAYDEMVSVLLNTIEKNGEITAGELRDHFQTTRKYAIGLLEHLDSVKITRRQGDVRVRGPNA